MNSIARQLATPTRGGPILAPAVDLYRGKKQNAFASGVPTFEESFNVLVNLLPSYRRTVIIVDALDECDQTRGKLISKFCHLIDESPSSVKVFISSRRDGDITDELQSAPNISIEATDNLEDITSFVEQNIQPLPINGELREEICSTLIEKSEGV
jgi:hypothetical protein